MKRNWTQDSEWQVFHWNHARLRGTVVVLSILGSIAISAAMIFGRRPPGAPPPWRDLPVAVLALWGCCFALYALWVVAARFLPVRVSRDGISASTALIFPRFVTWRSIDSAEITTLKGFRYLSLHANGRKFGPEVPMDLHRLGEFIALVRQHAGPEHPASLELERHRHGLVGADGEIARGPGFWRSLWLFVTMFAPVFQETTIARWLLCGPVALFASYLVWLGVTAIAGLAASSEEQTLAEHFPGLVSVFLASALPAAAFTVVGPFIAPTMRRRVAVAFALLALVASAGAIDLLSGRMHDAPDAFYQTSMAGLLAGATLGLAARLRWP